MKFYNRDKELLQINKILDNKNSGLVYISWRRRVWKTKLILKSLENKKFLYFFVWDKTKWELLKDWTNIIENKLWFKYLKFNWFNNFFDFLFDLSTKQNLIIVFDEFQNFYKIDKNIFSDLQYFWDLNKDKSNLKLFFLWSHFTLMKKIFENYSSPLYGRKTTSFHLKSFDINTQIQILEDYSCLSEQNLLYLYSIFYWIPKYLEIFFTNYNSKKTFFDNILDIIFDENSFFITEWKELFSLEFGKSYEIYSSILTAIANWKTKKNEIADFTWISLDSLWFYLKKLEVYYELIKRHIPITEKKNSKNSKYQINDLFLKFWFKFIYKYDYLLQIWNTKELKKIVKESISSFLWISFEKMIKDIILNENLLWKTPFIFTEIWSFYDKKWQNEIDLICLNKKEKKVLFIECKLNINKINLEKLKDKVQNSWIYYNYKKYYWYASLDWNKDNFDYWVVLKRYL